MNELQIFNNEEFGSVRTITKDGKTYFVGNDVAKALGYSETAKAIRTHCKGVSEMDIPTNGGVQTMKMITAGDIYRLVIKSQLPQAEKFESWVFDNVLPSIRKNGGYIANQEQMTPEQIVANALIVAQNIITQKDKQIEEMKPKADYFDELVDRNLLTNFRDTAKEFGVKESYFINWLLEKNYIYRDCKGKLQPYAASMDKGLFEIKEFSSKYSNHAGTQTLVTPRGRETFRLLLEKAV